MQLDTYTRKNGWSIFEGETHWTEDGCFREEVLGYKAYVKKKMKIEAPAILAARPSRTTVGCL